MSDVSGTRVGLDASVGWTMVTLVTAIGDSGLQLDRMINNAMTQKGTGLFWMFISPTPFVGCFVSVVKTIEPRKMFPVR
jgi:hypothetical protein